MEIDDAIISLPMMDSKAMNDGRKSAQSASDQGTTMNSFSTGSDTEEDPSVEANSTAFEQVKQEESNEAVNDEDENESYTNFKLAISDTEEEEEEDNNSEISQDIAGQSQLSTQNTISEDNDLESAMLYILERKPYRISNKSNGFLLGWSEIDGSPSITDEEEVPPLSEKSEKSEKSESKRSASLEPNLQPTKKQKQSPKVKSPTTNEMQKVEKVMSPVPVPVNTDAAPATTTVDKQNVRQKSSTKEPEPKHIVGDNDDSAVINNVKTKKRLSTNVAPTGGTPRPKKTTAAQNVLFKKPFEHGWKRELVWRSTGDSKAADIYYYTPQGKKLRSRTDIAPYLTGDLNLDNFCFSKESLNVGTEFETIRQAKTANRTISNIAQATVPPRSIGKRILKPKAPKGASPPPQGWTPTQALKTNNAALLGTPTVNRQSITSSHPATPTTSRNTNSTTQTHTKSSKNKKNSVDIEQDLKQINDSIRPNRKPSEKTSEVLLSTSTTANTSTSLQTVDNTNKQFATNFFANTSFAFDALINILKYLKIHERSRAASVCKLWHLAAKDTSLWKTVRMKNSRVCDWAVFAAALRRGETKHLDLRKMLIDNSKAEEMWNDFLKHIGTVYSLETIDLCRCSSRVVESLFQGNKNLRVLNALAINGDVINLENIVFMKELRELRLRTCDPAVIGGDLQPLKCLTNLTHLSITSIRGLGAKDVEVLGELVGLSSLELGECGDFDSTFANSVLPKLKNLYRLRLENSTKSNCDTLQILESIEKLKQLYQLELVNFDIKPGFDEYIRRCTNISKLLIIPTYISQSATTNHIVLSAVQQVPDTLKVFTWGVTIELLRVTSLYMDQCKESSKKKKNNMNERIPVLKPVPGALPKSANEEEEDTIVEKDERGDGEVPQLELLPLEKVEAIMAANMPKTKFTIIKMLYHSTCKQQLVE